MNTEQLYQVYLKNPSVQTDTRKLKPGDLFFALKGPHFNANSFAAQALELGAAAVVIDDPAFYVSDQTLVVDDVLNALQQLARHHRMQFDIPFIAITGSNGKTTTKELVSVVLARKYRTYTTEGNLNNHIGIPLTLLRVKKDAEMAVIEMGANHQGEIAGYCTYTLPTHGVITNCGKAHLEGFGGVEGVRKGKGELYDYLRKAGGKAFVMWDYQYLREMSAGIPEIITYGTADAFVTGAVTKNEPFLELSIISGPSIPCIQSQLVGAYNLPNILVAVTIAHHFNVDPDKIKAAIEAYAPSNSRSQLIQSGTNKIILDAYNANPSSLRLAIENLAGMEAGSKVLLLGAMAELGEESTAEHAAIIQLLGRYQWDAVVLVGGDFLKIDHPYMSFENSSQAKEWLQQQHFTNTTFLIKGSRSMQMERVLEH